MAGWGERHPVGLRVPLSRTERRTDAVPNAPGRTAVLVLLPPSEGKAPSGRGAPLKPESLSLPGLAEARQAVFEELVELCAADEEKAREVLGLSEGLRGEVAKNTELRTAGARPAGEIYTGVLYDALDLASLDTAAKRRAARSLLVFSGLWGAVRVTDRIPSYRCSMGVKLPGLGALGSHWRAPMASVLPEVAGNGLVLDLRSSAYTAAWKPKGRSRGARRAYGCCTRRHGRSSATSTRRPRAASSAASCSPVRRLPGPRSWWRRCAISGTWWRRRLRRERDGPGRWTCWWTRFTESAGRLAQHSGGLSGTRATCCSMRNGLCACCGARAG